MRAPLLSLVMLVACVSSGDPASPGAPAPPDPTTAPSGGPTWYRDVEPIVQVECVGCHVKNGTGGFLLDRETSTLLSKLIGERVSTRYMPPWPPGPGSAPLADSRLLGDAAVATIVAWAAAGAPLGDPRDHVERPARKAQLPARPADLHLAVAPADAYAAPSNPFVSDEVRCFVLDLPPTLTGGAWITAAHWRAGTPVGIHSLAGVPLDAESARVARGRQRRDGRSGFECGGGLGDLARGAPLGANGSGALADGTTLPEGTAVHVPAGGALLMSIHYSVLHLGDASDASGVDLWLASDAERKSLRDLELHTVAAPAEVPCPTGLSADAADPCNRDHAFSRLAVAPETPAQARARADALLASCGTTLDAYAARLTFTKTVPEHFLVPTSCARELPFDGVIHIVHARMQTRGASLHVDAERADGTWESVLDIPTWRWAWDGSYVLERGVAVRAGRKVRVSCIFDNGTAAQWSARTGEPGHDAPVRPPTLPPAYVIASPHRAAETCTAYLGIERTTR